MNEKMDIHDECLWMGYVLESEKALFQKALKNKKGMTNRFIIYQKLTVYAQGL